MVFFIFQNNVYVADNNKLPTLITQQELDNIAWNQPFAATSAESNTTLHRVAAKLTNSAPGKLLSRFTNEYVILLR